MSVNNGFRQQPQPEKKDIFSKLKIIELAIQELAKNDQNLSDFSVKSAQVTIGRFQEISSNINAVAFNLRVLTEYLFEKGVLVDKNDFDSFMEKKRIEFFDEVENQQDEALGIKVKDGEIVEGDIACIEILKAVDVASNANFATLETGYLQVYTGNEKNEFTEQFNQLIQSLTNVLIGAKAGDVLEQKAVMPSDFQDPLLADKEINFQIKILKVKSKI